MIAKDRKSLAGGAIASVALAICLLPTSLHAHDAFGDLGPFYANLLHPLADPLQAALLVGTAAFLATRPLSSTRLLLPVFAGAATLGALALAAGTTMTVLPVMAALASLLVGLSATVPDRWMPRPIAVILVAATGVLSGLAPGAMVEVAVLQPFLGTTIGIATLTTLTWSGLEAAGRRFTPLVPQVAGSWVAAIGILNAAFLIWPVR